MGVVDADTTVQLVVAETDVVNTGMRRVAVDTAAASAATRNPRQESRFICPHFPWISSLKEQNHGLPYQLPRVPQICEFWFSREISVRKKQSMAALDRSSEKSVEPWRSTDPVVSRAGALWHK